MEGMNEKKKNEKNSKTEQGELKERKKGRKVINKSTTGKQNICIIWRKMENKKLVHKEGSPES